MSDTATPTAPARKRGQRWRTALSVVLGILAIVALFATTVAVWAARTAFDSDKVADAVVDALAEPEVADAAADYITNVAMTLVDVEQRVDSILPEELESLQGAIVGGVRSSLHEAALRLLERPETLELLHTLIEKAHTAFVDLLEGQGLVDGITVENGKVTVNLLPLVSRALLRAQALGLFDDVAIPTLTADGDPDEQIAALETAFPARDLPDDFGQLTVYQSDSVAHAEASVAKMQQVLVTSRRAMWVLAALTVCLFAASIFAARRRRRAAIALALGALALMIITRTLLDRVLDKAPELVVTPGGRAMVTSMLDTLSSGLWRATALVIVVSVLAAVFLWITGPTGRFDARGAVSSHPEAVAVGSFALALVVLFLLGLNMLSVLIAGVLAVVGAGLLVNASRVEHQATDSH